MALSVLSCVRRYAVWLAPGARLTAPVFHLATERGGHEVMPLWALTVTPCFGKKYARAEQAAWVVVEQGDNALHAVRYGVTPRGFLERRAPVPLKVGGCYEVRATGPGISGATEFRVLPDSSLVERSKEEQIAAGDSAYRREVAHGDSSVAFCRRAYRSARTAMDTARADTLARPEPTGEFGPLKCGFLRSKAGGGLA
jgi:hypothetical protein